MNDMPLPLDLQHFSHLPDLQYRGSGEWSSSCPTCGGGGNRHDQSDRFRLFAADAQGNARVWCRQCGMFEWADKNDNIRPSPAQIDARNKIRQEYLEAENKRLRTRISELREQAYWKGFHDGMKEGQRALWRMAGIPDEFQDYWELGYTPEYKGRDFTSPAMTIPYFNPGREPVNVQYRLTTPPQPNDKYRFTAGLKPSLWLADPDDKPSGKVLLVEGMKKAGVCFVELVAKADRDITITAVPSKMPSQQIVDGLNDCEVVYIALDPDAYGGKDGAAERLGRMLACDVRYVRLPAKPDDLFIDYGFTAHQFMNFVNQAAKVAR